MCQLFYCRINKQDIIDEFEIAIDAIYSHSFCDSDIGEFVGWFQSNEK